MSYNLHPAVYKGQELKKIINAQNYHAIWIGDSFSTPVPSLATRLPWAAAACWDHRDSPAGGIGAYSWGFRFTGASGTYISVNDAVSLTINCDYRVNTSEDNYALFPDANPEYTAVPVTHIMSMMGNSAQSGVGSQNELLRWTFDQSKFDNSINGRLIENTGEYWGFYPIVFYPEKNEPTDAIFRICDVNDASTTDTVSTADDTIVFRFDGSFYKPAWQDGAGNGAVTGQINRYNTVLSRNTLDSNGDISIALRDPAGQFENDGEALAIGGGIWFKSDVSGNFVGGPYFSYMGDNSYSYVGVGGGPSTGNKQYSELQLTYWLNATTLSDAQPVVCFHHFAAEDLNDTNMRNNLNQVLDTYQGACDTLGLACWHVFVVPFVHTINDDENLDRIAIGNNRDMMFTLAKERSNVSVISLYDATNAIFFDGTADATDWLVQNGYDAFNWGNGQSADFTADTDLLDAGNLHIRNDNVGAFFATLMWDMIQNPARYERQTISKGLTSFGRPNFYPTNSASISKVANDSNNVNVGNRNTLKSNLLIPSGAYQNVSASGSSLEIISGDGDDGYTNRDITFRKGGGSGEFTF